MSGTKGHSGKPPGHPKTGGRPKGTPNRITAEMKKGFLTAFANLEPEMEDAIRAVMYGGQLSRKLPDGTVAVTMVEPDPLGAVKAVISMADFVFPRIGRTELTGKDGAALLPVFRIEESD